MREAVLDRRHPRTVKEAYTFLKVANRTWRRKQKIAELMILDRSRFEVVADGRRSSPATESGIPIRAM